MRRAVALAILLGALAAQPAAAQEFADIDTSRITGATIEQNDITDPEDLIQVPNGGYMAKPNARIVREERTCELDATAARAIADAAKHALRSPKQWEGLGADVVVRFRGGDGDYGELVGVFEGFDDVDSTPGQMRIFFAGVGAFLGKEEQRIVARVAAKAGCPFFRDPARR